MLTLVLTIERLGRPAETATFDAEELFVGRREGVDIAIPDTSVWRRHARIFRRGDAWFVEDLASRNGTKLNGVPVSGPTPFGTGDSVRIGDVAGKGMAAALMMAMAQTLFRATAGLGWPIEEVMAHLDRDLARDNDRAMFVTALGGCLNLETGLLHLVNAGHNLAYRVRRDGSFDLVRAANGVALGVVEDAWFPVTTMALEPGEALLAYTDGVCDAVSPSGAVFGTAGLERHLGAVGRLAADAVVASVFEVVERFAEGAPQEDDITVAMIRYHGPARDRPAAP